MANVNITGLSKAKVLKALHDNSIEFPQEYPGLFLKTRGGILVAKEVFEEENGFTPYKLILFWEATFSGKRFELAGVQKLQWKCFSWGVPDKNDFCSLYHYHWKLNNPCNS